MKTILGATLMALAFAAPAHAQQAAAPTGDAARGKTKISMCRGCHGIDGYRTAYPAVYHVPKIGGQNPGYIAKALEEYKAGERSHPSMRGIAASLTPQDMADLAAYYGAQSK